jgi:hypothetical protein
MTKTSDRRMCSHMQEDFYNLSQKTEREEGAGFVSFITALYV